MITPDEAIRNVNTIGIPKINEENKEYIKDTVLEIEQEIIKASKAGDLFCRYRSNRYIDDNIIKEISKIFRKIGYKVNYSSIYGVWYFYWDLKTYLYSWVPEIAISCFLLFIVVMCIILFI